jgi:hypothetical protein
MFLPSQKTKHKKKKLGFKKSQQKTDTASVIAPEISSFSIVDETPRVLPV